MGDKLNRKQFLHRCLCILLLAYVPTPFAQTAERDKVDSVQMDTIDTRLVVTPDFETFDLERFERIRLGPRRSNGAETLPDGTRILMQQRNSGSSFAKIPVNSHFGLAKIYYPNGNIREKGLLFVYDHFRKGTWHYFDEKGNLVESIDHDKPFKFTFEQVLEFAAKEGLVFMKTPVDRTVFGPVMPELRRGHNPETGEAWWDLSWFRGIPAGAIQHIRLCGKTGKEILRGYSIFGKPTDINVE